MKYFGMPFWMWFLFKRSFRSALHEILYIDKDVARSITKKAKGDYKKIIKKLPEFEEGDPWKKNLVSAAMFASFYLNMPSKPSLDSLSAFYALSMSTFLARRYYKHQGKKKFDEKTIGRLRLYAKQNYADHNPYSWNYKFRMMKDNAGYTCTFTKCGICRLFNELGCPEIVTAMCRFDHALAKLEGTSTFSREYTLASGGPYCDCHYKKKLD